MPTNAVKTKRDEHLWSRAKAAAEDRGRGGDYAYIMGIYQRMKEARKGSGSSGAADGVAKSFIAVPTTVPGQIPGLHVPVSPAMVPYSARHAIPRDMRPMLSVSATTDGLGLGYTERGTLNNLIRSAARTADNEVIFRKDLHQSLRQHRMPAALRRVVFQRAVSFYRSAMSKAKLKLPARPRIGGRGTPAQQAAAARRAVPPGTVHVTHGPEGTVKKVKGSDGNWRETGETEGHVHKPTLTVHHDEGAKGAHRHHYATPKGEHIDRIHGVKKSFSESTVAAQILTAATSAEGDYVVGATKEEPTMDPLFKSIMDQQIETYDDPAGGGRVEKGVPNPATSAPNPATSASDTGVPSNAPSQPDTKLSEDDVVVAEQLKPGDPVTAKQLSGNPGSGGRVGANMGNEGTGYGVQDGKMVYKGTVEPQGWEAQQYSTTEDERISAMMKSEGGIDGTVAPINSPMFQQQTCTGCGDSFAKCITVCPSCNTDHSGVFAGQQGVLMYDTVRKSIFPQVPIYVPLKD